MPWRTMRAVITFMFCIGLTATSAIRSKEKERTKRFLGARACSDLLLTLLSNCNSYDPSACKTQEYKEWATQQCARTCNVCARGTSHGSNGTGNGGATNGSSSGCVYKTKTYHEGQSWTDGCKYRCHCIDNISGQYTCNQLCPLYQFPSACHIGPPVRGNCCPKPYCPADFMIDYPPGYTEM